MSALEAFAKLEQQLTGNVIDLSTAQRAEPIKTVEEIRQEWLKQRYGKFTASEFHRLMAYPNKPTELPAGAKTYALEKAIELLTEFHEEPYINAEMQWGLDHELEAIAEFSKKIGRIVDKTGQQQAFITLKNDVGCTPDGLIGKTSGIEVKCPKSTTHFSYLSLKTAEDLKITKPDYYWQIQGSLWITRRLTWWFVSYDPRFKSPKHRLKILCIKRNPDDIDFLKYRLKMAIDYRNTLIKTIGKPQ
ncbi:MAG: YqaJ viral recombinase family protein [Methylomicrobium sp.]|nr:YqaJ viral recombinase family protein [Methylomicrobium sp.]